MITLKHLAQKLNVSVSTVSKALNDSPEISVETKNRIKKIAELYNYRPNKIAQSLKQNETRTIGVVIPDILNRFFAKVLNGIEKEAGINGYQIITCISNELLDKEKQSLTLLTNGSVDGLIIAISEETIVKENFDHIQGLINSKIPVVLFDRVIDQLECDKVAIDDIAATFEATQMLIELERTNIAFFSTINNLNVGKLREQGYKEAIKGTCKKLESNLIFNFNSSDNLQEKILATLRTHPQIDAVLSADNVSGTMSINVAKSLGRKVPEDIAVIGFSDNVRAQLTIPKLSYINQHAMRIGQEALQLMVRKLNSKQEDFTFKKVDVSFEGHQSLY